MTQLPLTTSARDALTVRLDSLRTQRAQALIDSTPPSGPGDAADRTGSIEALARLADLDARIAALELRLEAPAAPAPQDAVAMGALVTLRYGSDEAPEKFLIGFVEQAGPDLAVITPASPLGKALLGAHPGEVVEYRGANGSIFTATLIDIAA
jgi:transcription elongation factor GreA